MELRSCSAPRETTSLEPNVRAVAALFSPNTGIVNAHALMDHLARQARAAGALIQLRSELLALERRGSDYRLTVRTPDGLESFTSERVVNAAGLESDTVAALCGIDVAVAGYRLHWCKGSYFSVAAAKARLVSRLVYPVPGHESLGVHAVLGLEGRLRFGPDVEYLAERQADYRVREERRAAFGAAVRRLVPAIRDEDLEPDMSGIRAKLQGPGRALPRLRDPRGKRPRAARPREPDRDRFPRPHRGPGHRRPRGRAHDPLASSTLPPGEARAGPDA